MLRATPDERGVSDRNPACQRFEPVVGLTNRPGIVGVSGNAYPPAGRGMIDCTLLRPDWEETLLIAQFDWLWPYLAGDGSPSTASR